jgi:hypothetical protein
MIKLSPAYEGFLEDKKMDWRDLDGILHKHAANHTKNFVRSLYMSPDILQKIDPLGQSGYIGWRELPKVGENNHYIDRPTKHHFEHGSCVTKEIAIFCNPPHLKEDFPFEVIGLIPEENKEK